MRQGIICICLFLVFINCTSLSNAQAPSILYNPNGPLGLNTQSLTSIDGNGVTPIYVFRFHFTNDQFTNPFEFDLDISSAVLLNKSGSEMALNTIFYHGFTNDSYTLSFSLVSLVVSGITNNSRSYNVSNSFSDVFILPVETKKTLSVTLLFDFVMGNQNFQEEITILNLKNKEPGEPINVSFFDAFLSFNYAFSIVLPVSMIFILFKYFTKLVKPGNDKHSKFFSNLKKVISDLISTKETISQAVVFGQSVNSLSNGSELGIGRATKLFVVGIYSVIFLSLFGILPLVVGAISIYFSAIICVYSLILFFRSLLQKGSRYVYRYYVPKAHLVFFAVLYIMPLTIGFVYYIPRVIQDPSYILYFLLAIIGIIVGVSITGTSFLLILFSGYYLSENISEIKDTALKYSNKLKIPQKVSRILIPITGWIILITLISQVLRNLTIIIIYFGLSTPFDESINRIAKSVADQVIYGTGIELLLFFGLFFIQPILAIISGAREVNIEDDEDKFIFLRLYKRLTLNIFSIIMLVLSIIVVGRIQDPTGQKHGIIMAHNIQTINGFESFQLFGFFNLFFILGFVLSIPRLVFNLFSAQPMKMYPVFKEENLDR